MKEVRIGRPITFGDVTIVPLERVSVNQLGQKGGLSLYITKEPLGIMIGSPQGKWVFDIYGGEMPLDNYVKEVQGLQEVWDNL